MKRLIEAYVGGTARGACYLCGASQRALPHGGVERIVDTGVEILHEGRLLICEACLVEMGVLVDLADQRPLVGRLTAEAELLAAEIAGLRDQLADQRQLVDLLRRVDDVAEPAPPAPADPPPKPKRSHARKVPA